MIPELARFVRAFGSGPDRGPGRAVVYNSRYGAPFIYPAWSGYESVDATHNLRLRFHIPSNLAVLQKTTVSFSGLPFRSGLQSTAAANTSGASSSSTTDDENAHVHGILIKGNTGLTTALFLDLTSPSTIGKNVGTDSDGGNTDGGSLHHHGMAHTHPIPALSLNNPTGLFETGMARNVHMLVDGVDVSSAVGGPWDGGGSAFDVNEVDISAYIQSGGFHEIQLTSTAIGGVKANVDVYGLLKSV